MAPLSVPSADTDDLTSTNVLDHMANDQTWPTEDDMTHSANGSGNRGKRKFKRVPKGTSAYQAAWIVDDDDDDSEDDEDDEDMEAESGDGDDDSVPDLVNADEETEDVDVTETNGDLDDDLDPEEEERE